MSDQPVNILYVAEYSTGGSVESLLCLVGGLDKSQYRPTVLFYYAPEQRIVDRFEHAGAVVRSLWPAKKTDDSAIDIRKRSFQGRVRKIFGKRIERLYESFKYILHFLRFRLPIYRALKNEFIRLGPDLIHLNNGVRSDTPGMLAARHCDIPTVCHVRTFSKLTQVNVAAAKHVRQFICISNAVRETLMGYGVSSEKSIVVPNAVDAESFRKSDREAELVRSEFGFDDSKMVFTLVGRIVSWKGHEDFIDAIAEARRENDSIVGLIVGDAAGSRDGSDYLSSLVARVKTLNLESSFLFAGHRTDIPNIMAASNVVVCASSEPEPFGRVIIESMAMGTTVIATDAGGAPDIVRDGINGILVPIGDSAAMANAMLRLSRQTEFAKTLSVAGHRDVRQRFSVEIHVKAVCRVYESINQYD